MPNWCDVEITIDGDMEKVIPLISGEDCEGKEKDVTFNVLIPMPENIERGNCPGNKLNSPDWWYHWCTTNWGTKWDACNGCITDNTIYFSTAWTAPTPWLEEFAKALGVFGIEAHVNCWYEGLVFEEAFEGYDISDGTLWDGEATEEFKEGYRWDDDEEEEEE